ncbi:MAG: S41 family peptidase [Lysobacterales bacterium]
MKSRIQRWALACLLVLAATGLLAEPGEAPKQSFEAVAEVIARQMRAHHFDPAIGSSPALAAVESKVSALAAKPQTQQAFVAEFNRIWRDGPFSHVNLVLAQGNAAQMADQLDQMRVGGGGARLSWPEPGVALLTVNTMMGSDTIEEIAAAYGEIVARSAQVLIIDLRANEGGAFAVVPLIGHLIDRAFDAGAFVSREWYGADGAWPTLAEVEPLQPWTGWSIKRFWADAESHALTCIQFQPMAPRFDGPVYVLTSRRTASAAELAADALRGSGRATLIGEITAGNMLSQKPFDLPEGMQLFLPIADYYSFHGGHIEGTGVRPDIAVPAPQALDQALTVAAQTVPSVGREGRPEAGNAAANSIQPPRENPDLL